ncbi:hypothetical protein BKL51_00725 [Rodentibacter sp. Ppn85]|nr:hypothetical protein BKL51_00725 [Rodentibacter sp. Ppn85]
MIIDRLEDILRYFIYAVIKYNGKNFKGCSALLTLTLILNKLRTEEGLMRKIIGSVLRALLSIIISTYR